jgi:hypothetical protein
MIASAIGRSAPGGMSIARICGMERGRTLLVRAQASQAPQRETHEIGDVEGIYLRQRFAHDGGVRQQFGFAARNQFDGNDHPT